MADLKRILPLLTHLSLLQSSAVTAASESYYDWHVLEFLTFLIQLMVAPITHLSKLDCVLVSYFDLMFSEGASAPYGEKLLAGLAHRMPGTPGTLSILFPGASRSLRGWRRLRPPSTRPPLPFNAALILAAALTSFHGAAMGLAILIGFFAYLRPRELTGLLTSQLIRPIPGAHSVFSSWSICLHTLEDLKPSKTGHYDESIPLDSPWLASWIGPFLDALLTGRAQCQRLWPFSHEQLAAAYATELKRLGMLSLSQSLYALRHGGASHDTLFQLREPHAVKLRGRWVCDKSLLRYRKAALAQKEMSKLSPAHVLVAAELDKSPAKFFRELSTTRALITQLVTPISRRRRSSAR